MTNGEGENPDRAVDQAMAEQRQAKDAVRRLWVDLFSKEHVENQEGRNAPTYLTLSGAGGHDIQAICDEDLIQTTEAGQIAEEDSESIVAVESNSVAYAKVKRKFPGIKVLEQRVEHILAGEGLLAWPQGKHRRYARARVVNLDLASSLTTREEEGRRYYPVIVWIRKFGRVHADPEPSDWVLCLTLNAELPWDDDDTELALRFLRDNMNRDEEFEESCRQHLNEGLTERVMDEEGTLEVGTLDPIERQKLLMVYVPKRVARVANDQGWRLQTRINLRYGGGDHAEMVTWIFRFTWDEAVEAEPDASYRSALRCILSNVGHVNEDGTIETRSLTG